jgi:hypothetical protein
MIMRHFNHCLQIHEVFADALQIPEINIKWGEDVFGW